MKIPLTNSCCEIKMVNISLKTLTVTLIFLLSPYVYLQENVEATSQLESIVLGSGCFWGEEKRYESLPGVISAISGYADGKGVKPTYKEITKLKNRFNPNNHAEVVLVVFDRNVVTLEQILRNYFEGHDPTQLNRQGNDVGTQYRSVILTINEGQKEIAQRLLDQFQILLNQKGYGKIQTKIKPLVEFHYAEEYHQDYLVKNPNGYCPDHSTGIVFQDQESLKKVDNDFLFEGKHILVIESDSCPYCIKFRENVLSKYKGTIPLSFRTSSQLNGLSIKTETWATPTVLLLEDGKEIYGKRGYMDGEEFYKFLGIFKLGKTEAFNVAFNEGTDARYCKEYEIFKNTPDGVFTDKLSGAALFDTRDRFNSRTGWLSFTKAIDGSVTEHLDTSLGMIRTELRSKSSGIHLGHVFPDGPRGMPRYCINATVLDFKPREVYLKSG